MLLFCFIFLFMFYLSYKVGCFGVIITSLVCLMFLPVGVVAALAIGTGLIRVILHDDERI